MKCKIFIIICLIMMFLSACGTKVIDNLSTDQVADIVTISPSPTAIILTPTPIITPLPTSSSAPEPTATLVLTPIVEQEYPILDEKITKSITTYMYESFGGSGDEEFASSWYKYVDYWKVFRNGDRYAGFLFLRVSDDEPSIDDIEHVSMAALAGFEDVRIETMDVIDQNGNTVYTCKNLK